MEIPRPRAPEDRIFSTSEMMSSGVFAEQRVRSGKVTVLCDICPDTVIFDTAAVFKNDSHLRPEESDIVDYRNMAVKGRVIKGIFLQNIALL